MLKSLLSRIRRRLDRHRQGPYRVFLRQFQWIHPDYRVAGCRTVGHRNLAELKWPGVLKKPLEFYVQTLCEKIDRAVENKQSFSVIRMGDGEAYTLSGRWNGNVTRRHFNKRRLSKDEIELWREIYKRNDIRSYDISGTLRELWVEHEGPVIRNDFFPLNAVYASVASRRLFKSLLGKKVGLIGASEKLDLIEKLQNFSEYRESIHGLKFQSFLGYPQRFACENVEETTDDLVKTIKKDPCDVYLVGMGISKLYALRTLAEATSKVFIDLGSGLDALAGLVPHDRPYFADWVNFKIEGYDYSKIDQLRQFAPDGRLKRFRVARDRILGQKGSA